MIPAGSLLHAVPHAAPEEVFDLLLNRPGLRIERIVSCGQASPPGFWYDQADGEFVLLVQGAARLLIEGEAAPRELRAGDWLVLPAGRRHRVEWTQASPPTVWLAVHYADAR